MPPPREKVSAARSNTPARAPGRTARLTACLVMLVAAAPAADYVALAKGTGGAWCFQRGSEKFLSMGICHIAEREDARGGTGRFYDGAKLRGGAPAWASLVQERMSAWGFNTAGAWCSESVYEKANWQTRYVWLGAEVGGIRARLLNVFSEGYGEKVDELCAKFVAPHRDEARLVGWFLDNELPWYGEFGWFTDPDRSLLDLALALPASDPNRAEAVAFLKLHYIDFARFAAQWDCAARSWEDLARGGTARATTRRADAAKDLWAGRVAERFFKVCTAAVRRHDPNHLILGCRFAGNAPGPVIAACARYCDVVSINRYQKDGHFDAPWWDALYAIAQRPILVTEFSWRATENRSGNRNTLGADVTVPSQADRAERYRTYVRPMMCLPYILGMHWFQWADEPENGRYDGEDSNYGLVDWRDEPYEELVAAARATHASMPAPDARGGALPPAGDPADLLRWTARPLASLQEGSLADPLELARADAAPSISLDEKAGTRATASREGDAWRIGYDSGTGWGFNAEWPIPPGTALAGAKTLRLRGGATPGVKCHAILFEQGDHDPRHAATDKADGECWMLGPIDAARLAGGIALDLAEAELNLYHGNQRGNRRIDLDGLRAAGLYFSSGQGTGSVQISAFTLAE